MFTRFLVSLAFLFVAINVTVGQQRTWVDSSGKHRTKAEFVAVKGDVVTLRNEAGRLIQVPLQRLSQGDREFIQQQDGKTDSASATSVTVGKPALAKPIARRFYYGLIDEDFDALMPLMSSAATTNWDATKTQLEELDVPDNRQAVLVRTAEIEEGMAVVNVSIKVRGKYLKQLLRMRWTDDAWRIAELVLDDEEAEPIRFERNEGDRLSRRGDSRRNDDEADDEYDEDEDTVDEDIEDEDVDEDAS